MEERINAGQVSSVQEEESTRDDTAKVPPELGKRLLDVWTVGITGTSAWFVAFIVLLVMGVAPVWIYTAVAGMVIGLLGMALMLWQRSAFRRGSRSAQRGLF